MANSSATKRAPVTRLRLPPAAPPPDMDAVCAALGVDREGLRSLTARMASRVYHCGMKVVNERSCIRALLNEQAVRWNVDHVLERAARPVAAEPPAGAADEQEVTE